MPQNVRRFAWLWMVSALAAIPEILVTPTPNPSVLRMGITRTVEMDIELGATLFFFVLLLPFFWLAVWKRKNWARWVLFATFVISLPLLFLKPSMLLRSDYIPMTSVTFVGLAVEIAAFYFLFTGDARRWFQREDAH